MKLYKKILKSYKKDLNFDRIVSVFSQKEVLCAFNWAKKEQYINVSILLDGNGEPVGCTIFDTYPFTTLGEEWLKNRFDRFIDNVIYGAAKYTGQLIIGFLLGTGICVIVWKLFLSSVIPNPQIGF